MGVLARGFAGAPVLLAALAGVMSVVASCALPGETLGTYEVTGSLGDDTCGDAPGAWSFLVMLSQKNATLYWSWLDASPILSGPITPSGEAMLSGYQLHNVDSTDAGMGPCDLQRSDAIEVTLGPGSPPSSFRATVSYSFSVQEGATCADQLVSSGGTYARLPCAMSYALTATRQ
jgi:hypothetical protein